MNKPKELEPKQLKKQWPSLCLPFETTEELEPLQGIIGQKRAVRAMEFGVRTKAPGYNIFLTGISGTGKTTYAKEYITQIAKQQPVPDDWCYVYNFENPSQPVAIRLPSGKGKEFLHDMEELIEDLKAEISKAFGGDEYENEKALIYKEMQEKRNELFNQFNEYAKQQGFQVNTSSAGIYFTPIMDGQPLGEEEYNKLDEETKKSINERLTQIQLQAVEVIRKIKELEKEAKNRVKELENRIGTFAVGIHIEDMKKKYAAYPKILKYLDDLMKDVLQSISNFKESESSEEDNPIIHALRRTAESTQHKYKVNLLVDNSDREGAPVIIEYNPTYSTLFGSLEYENKLGTMVTDFTMIKPGAIHLANGGYLILQAKDVLSVPFMWEGLKKVLKTKSITVESLRDQWGLISMSGLKPEPIPVDIKVVLVGSDLLFQLLHQLDEDFAKLFKVKVDFDDEMEANEENLLGLAKFISGYCRRENLRHFSRDAVLSVADYASRLVEHQEKFTTRFNDIVEIIVEANTWAEVAGKSIVTSQEVKKAIEEKEYRSSKYDEKLMELLKNDVIMVETEGEAIGQINGLAVIQLGDYVFGKPTKITATTFMGRSGIVNIEREVDMSGRIHSKGVMILSAYIGEQYAQEIPLALTANITFEQLYSGIEGDSASSAELYAILSSLAEVPIKQGIAVTGSVNQKGEIQPVGGVTYKIEGFFELCKARGLTGEQGVIIPYQNIKNLVLKDEVIEAVKEGKFHIYPIKTIDEGVEILMGIPAGKKLENGFFEKGTLHERVYNKLRQYALTMVNFGKEDKESEN
ncbi:AAA family ATPase [Caldicoprobacter algeriensis]|uniref:Lon protease family protein n=1 Tax=Caldicoprobacter algeriensis TaxID=699281 RepID=UPI0020794658|nr:ATP-binding protein [Caldicoprobacter algeriensis]MCM8901016.1 AAA family ATPase [Caldicoprobacter algeriensis]